jgi:hypothetical protein
MMLRLSGRPARYRRYRLFLWNVLRIGRLCVHIRCPQWGEECSLGDLAEVSAMADTAVGAAIFNILAVLTLLCRFRLRTSVKPSSWVEALFGVGVGSVVVLAFSKDFSSCTSTV